MGPVADAVQVQAVQGFIDVGLQDGRALTGASKATNGIFAPTIFVDIPEDSKINKEEVFGPVTIVHRFNDEAAVIKAANDSEYGLYASVRTVANIVNNHGLLTKLVS